MRVPRLPRDPRALPLSPRQREVWALMARGLTNKQIARHMGLAVGTVKVHVCGILARTGSATRTHAAILYRDAA